MIYKRIALLLASLLLLPCIVTKAKAKNLDKAYPTQTVGKAFRGGRAHGNIEMICALHKEGLLTYDQAVFYISLWTSLRAEQDEDATQLGMKTLKKINPDCLRMVPMEFQPRP